MEGFIKKNRTRIYANEEALATSEQDRMYKEYELVMKDIKNKERYIEFYIEHSFNHYLWYPYYTKITKFTMNGGCSSGIFDRKNKFSIDWNMKTITLNDETFLFCWCEYSFKCEHNQHLKFGKYAQIIEDLCSKNLEHSVEMAEYSWERDLKNE